MLETLMLATEPSAIWGAGPGAEPIGWWARLFDSIANDPSAVATIAAAFFGFLGGVLIKYKLDRRFDRLRRETDKRILATALRAELLRLDVECESRIERFEKQLEDDPERENFGGPHYFAHLLLPPRVVWLAHLHRIGELEGFAPDVLTLVHAKFDNHDLETETLKQLSGEQGVTRQILQEDVRQLGLIRKVISTAGEKLYKLPTVRPPWWRRLWHSKGGTHDAESSDRPART
jgi:hypothetical protein